jgi:nicotinamidase-related amidase
MGRTVLMLMDYQEAICREEGHIGRHGLGSEVARRGTLLKAQRALLRFRESGDVVVHVRVAFDEGYERLTSASAGFQGMKRNRLMLETDPATNICGEVEPASGELVINKGCTNPFIGTNLTQKLVSLQASRLVLGGVATNHVVESAARFATDSGYDVIVLEDLCASSDPELHSLSTDRILPRYASVMQSDEYFANPSDLEEA